MSPKAPQFSLDVQVKRSGRAQTVTIVDAWDGEINTNRRGPAVVLPLFRWSGGLGFAEVQITPEFCEAVGLDTPVLPSNEDAVGPIKYGSEFDNRWVK